MWGNRLGWGISAVIVLIACFIGYIIYQAGQPTGPTGFVEKSVHRIEVPAGKAEVLPAGKGIADAGPMYRDAIKDYQSNKSAYDAMLDAKEIAGGVTHLPGIVALLKATDSPTMNLFRDRPEEVVNYEIEKPNLEALYIVGKVAARIALLESADKNYDEAKKYYNAVFALGLNLYRERVVYDELSKAEEFLGTGAGGLARVAEKSGDHGRAVLLKSWDNDRVTDFVSNIQPVWKIISTIDAGLIAQHSGDIFQIAQDKQIDHLWRTEATLKIGRLKYNAAKNGDQLLAHKFTREKAMDSAEDPAVKLAATIARDLTVEDYRNIR